MIEWIHVAGYKCLRDVKTDVGPFNVLVGRNDSGKSSFLQVIHAISNRTEDLGGPRLGAMRASQARPALELQVAGRPLARYAADGYWYSGSGEPAIQTSDLGVGYATEPLSIDPPAIAHASPRESAALPRLIATRGGGTAAHLAALALGDRARFEAVQLALREMTQGRVSEFVVTDVGAGYQLSYRLYDGTVIPAADASQGLLIVTCFLAVVHRQDAPSVLLIEEPENGIHPLRLKEVVDLLRTLTTRGVQIFLTTHSPDLLSWCAPEEVLVFWRPQPDSGTEIHRLPPDFEKRVALGSTLGEVWASRGEEGLLDMLGTVHPFVREVAT